MNLNYKIKGMLLSMLALTSIAKAINVPNETVAMPQPAQSTLVGLTPDSIHTKPAPMPLPPEYSEGEIGIGNFERSQINDIAEVGIGDFEHQQINDLNGEVGIGNFEQNQINQGNAQSSDTQERAIAEFGIGRFEQTLQEASALAQLHPRFKFTIEELTIPENATILARKDGVTIYIEGNKPVELDPRSYPIMAQIEGLLRDLGAQVHKKAAAEINDQVIVSFEGTTDALNELLPYDMSVITLISAETV